ncbi:tRNA dihydrouridine synthase DusB [Terrarubrum flagellatum]|uniref:tRNA dihydrouridine synthase DusB n=1 Tax=Terrirubrum flagellatum TaxID=2895980 RepID=UPI00314547EA
MPVDRAEKVIMVQAVNELAQTLGTSAGGDVIGARLGLGALILAPMSGVTDVVFRRIAHRFGAALVVSEMVASDALARRDHEALLRSEGTGVHPHVVQLAGCDAKWMAEAAQVAESSGAAVIDINMGCPAKKVVGGWAGSALMRDLAHATTLIEAVAAAVKVPVTLKMRLGWDDASRNAPDLALRAQACGVRMVTVHGRTRCQFYKGRADWPAIRSVADAVSIPTVANGDIVTADDARLCLDQSGAQALMVGRSALGRAWLPAALGRALRDGGPALRPAASVRRDAAIEHYDGLLALYGRNMGLRHARKHVAAYLQDACLGAPDRLARHHGALMSEDPSEVVRHIRDAFDADETWAIAA